MMTRFISLFTHPLVATYFYLFLYIGLSSGVILYNKVGGTLDPRLPCSYAVSDVVSVHA